MSRRRRWRREEVFNKKIETCEGGPEGPGGGDSQSGGAGDDLNELLGDDGLPSAVEGEGQLVNHLGCRREEEEEGETSVKGHSEKPQPSLHSSIHPFFHSSIRLTGVLAGAVHGRHPGALLAGGRLPQGQVDDVDQGKLLVVPQHVGVDVVVDAHGLCTNAHRRGQFGTGDKLRI